MKDLTETSKPEKLKTDAAKRTKKLRWESQVYEDVLVPLGELFAESPTDFKEFQIALEELRPGHTISISVQRRMFKKLNQRMEERWRALGFLNERNSNARVYSPCLELLQALATATGLSKADVIEFVIRDYAAQVAAGRFNFVESIVATQLQANVVVSTATKILDRLDLSTDDRLKHIAKTRIAQRRRNMRFKNIMGVPEAPASEEV